MRISGNSRCGTFQEVTLAEDSMLDRLYQTKEDVAPMMFTTEIDKSRRVSLDQLMIDTIIADNKLGES